MLETGRESPEESGGRLTAYLMKRGIANLPKQEQLSAANLLRIRQICAQDTIVCRMAKSRLIDAVNRLSDAEKAELEAFKRTGRLE